MTQRAVRVNQNRKVVAKVRNNELKFTVKLCKLRFIMSDSFHIVSLFSHCHLIHCYFITIESHNHYLCLFHQTAQMSFSKLWKPDLLFWGTRFVSMSRIGTNKKWPSDQPQNYKQKWVFHHVIYVRKEFQCNLLYDFLIDKMCLP